MTTSELDRAAHRATRREFLRRSVLISGGVALTVACGQQAVVPAAPTAPAGGQAPAVTSVASSGAPKKGGTMRVAFGVDITTLDPHLSGSKIDRQVYHNLYDPPLALDEKLGS